MIPIQDLLKFYRSQLTRCKINLKDAFHRKDTKAVENIQRKIEIYEQTIEIIRRKNNGNQKSIYESE